MGQAFFTCRARVMQPSQNECRHFSNVLAFWISPRQMGQVLSCSSASSRRRGGRGGGRGGGGGGSPRAPGGRRGAARRGGGGGPWAVQLRVLPTTPQSQAAHKLALPLSFLQLFLGLF